MAVCYPPILHPFAIAMQAFAGFIVYSDTIELQEYSYRSKVSLTDPVMTIKAR